MIPIRAPKKQANATSATEAVLRCPICGKPGSPFKSVVEGWHGKALNVDQCPKCGLKFQNPRPSKKALKKYYQSGNYHKAYAPSDKEERIRADRVNLMVDRFGLNPRRCLDVGCRRGFLLQQLQVYNFASILGLEYNPEMPSIPEFVTSEEEVTGKFDLITCIQVLEQVHDPLETVKWMAGLLNPGGTLLLEVPMDEKIFLPRIYNFTKRSLELMLEGLGLKYLYIDQGVLCQIFIGEQYENVKVEKVFYSFDSPDLDSKEEYLNWLSKSYGKTFGEKG